MKMKRIPFLIVAILLVSVLASGCQPAATPTSAGPTPTPAPVELHIYMTQIGEDPSLDINTTQLPVFAELEKRLNVKLVISAFSSDDYGNVLLPLIASGQNLPDAWVMGGADLVQMGNDGTIIDLKDLMAQYAPKTMALLEQYPLAKYSITAPDGKIWGFPNRIAPFDDNFQGLDLGYRQDWATKLKNEGKIATDNPVTLEDWEAMLLAFKNDDPNGNGKPDELALAAPAPVYLFDWALPFGMSPWSGWFSSWDGKVTFDWTDPNGKAKDYVKLMNKWYDLKIMDQDILVDHGAAIDAGLLGDTIGAHLTWTGSFAGFTAQMNKNGYPNAVWMVALPPKGPGGDGLKGQSYENYSYVNGERWMISKDCKNPEAMIRLLDYTLADPDGQILNNFGIEGTAYTMVDGTATFTNAILHENKYNDAAIAIAVQGCGKFANFVREDAETQTYALTYSPDLIARMGEVKSYVRVMFPFVTATSAESETLKKMTDINTTVDEYMAKYVTGSLDIDATWDAFVKMLKDQGIDECIAAKQAQYDRFYQVAK